MGGIVALQGELTAGPQGSGDCAFPGGVFDISLVANKSFGASMNGAPNVASPNAFVTLPGIGVGGLVTQANFLFVRTNTKMLLRLTTNGDSGDVVSVLYVQGLLIQQFPDTNYLKLLEAEGTGTVEFLATGNQ